MRDRRGNVLVLVVVVLVLMAMLGASYIQLARVQRVPDVEPVDNIDLVIQSVIDEIARLLKNDVTGDSTNQFFTSAQKIEPYDYPWTDTSVGTEVIYDPLTNSAYTVKQEAADDRWLSTTTPTFPGGVMTWPKITILGRVYLEPNSGPDDFTTGFTARPLNGPPYYDQNQVESVLVDTDNDGFGDARWERAPIPLMTGNEYFSAARIFDASALINIASATCVTPDGDTPSPANVTGYFPTSLDLSRLTARKFGATWTTSVTNIFNNIRNGLPGAIDPAEATLFGLTDLSQYWADTSYGDGQIKAWLGVTTPSPGIKGVSEPGLLANYVAGIFELHHRNGVDNGTDDINYEAEAGALLDTSYVYASATPIPDAAEHYYGTGGLNTTTNDGPLDPTASGIYAAIRHMLTTLSGHGIYAPNHGNMHAGAHTLKQDLLYQENATAQNRTDLIYARLQKIFALGAGYTGGDTGAAQFALAIQEYSDRDGKPSATLTVGTKNWYALEALPFLREVYIQGGYNESGDGNGDADPANEFEAVNNSQAIAIEIGNPFDRPINFGGADGPEIRIAVIQNGADVFTHDVNSGTLNPRDVIVANEEEEHVIYYVNPITGVDEGGVKNNMPVDLGFDTATNAAVQMSPSGAPFAANDQAITVELRVKVADGSYVAYDRLTNADLRLPTWEPVATAPPVATAAHIQISLKRDGEGIHYISNTGADTASRPPTPDPTPTWPDDGGYSATIDSLNQDNKGITGNSGLDSFQLPMANAPIFAVAELGWICTVGFNADATGGTFPELLDARNISFPNSLTLNFAAAKTIESNTLNHAHIVMDQFTTLSPRYDSLDNDGDGDTDEADEQFVFGTVNINTMPRHLLTYVLPYPDTIANCGLIADQIISRRTALNGFRSIGQLMDATTMTTIVDNTAPAGALDMYPMYEATQLPPSGQNAVVYTGIANDAEAKLKRFQFLSQGLTTRSDIFIATILAKGYKSGDYAAGVQESARVIVVFDRSNLTSNTDSIRVLGVYTY